MPVIKAVIFDWSGTLVDAYALSVLRAFTATFAKYGVTLTPEAIFRDIGLSKRKHIKLVSTEYSSKILTNSDTLYNEYLKHQRTCIETRSKPLPGVRHVLEGLRRDGVRIGVTTGFPSVISNEILGKFPVKIDVCVSSDTLPNVSRPQPDMINECMRVLGITDKKQVLKVGDTVLDVYEGVNAGCWTAGVYEHSAHVAESNMQHTVEQLQLAGADFVIREITQIPKIIRNIEKL